MPRVTKSRCLSRRFDFVDLDVGVLPRESPADHGRLARPRELWLFGRHGHGIALNEPRTRARSAWIRNMLGPATRRSAARRARSTRRVAPSVGAARRLRQLSRSLSRRPPTSQRCGAFVGSLPDQERLDGNILVEIGPVNSDPRTDQLPATSLGGCGFRESRVPLQWHRHRTAILELHNESLACNPNLTRRCRFSDRT